VYSKLTHWILFLVVLLAVDSSSASAQTIYGSLAGDIIDASGAAVPGAAVVVRNINTGIERRDKTDASGFWRIPSLDVGTYEVTATATGFGTVIQGPIVVDAAVERKIEFSLKPSSQTTTVTINSQAPLIEATTSQLSGMENAKQILELPTGGNTDTLAKLMAGVAQNNPGVCCSHYSVNGGSERSNHYTIDNADNNDPGSTEFHGRLHSATGGRHSGVSLDYQ
jgi:hypothetical protein